MPYPARLTASKPPTDASVVPGDWRGRSRTPPPPRNGLAPGRLQGDNYVYEGFNHDPAWRETPERDYLGGTTADLRRLPQLLQEDAVLVDAGEASWSWHLIEAALNALG